MPQFVKYTLEKDLVIKDEVIAKAGEIILAQESLSCHHYVKANGRNFTIPNSQFFDITKTQEKQNAA